MYSNPMSKSVSKKKTPLPQVTLQEGKIFELKENAKYLLVFPTVEKGDLEGLNDVLSKFFGEKKVIALFVNDINDVKIAELLETHE